jgi:hypothetical protein
LAPSYTPADPFVDPDVRHRDSNLVGAIMHPAEPFVGPTARLHNTSLRRIAGNYFSINIRSFATNKKVSLERIQMDPSR